MVLSAADHHFSGLKWGQRVGPTLGEWRGIFFTPYQEYCFSHIRMWSWKTQLSNFKTRTQQFILQWKIRTPRRLFPFQKWNEHPPKSTSPYPPTKREVSKKSSGVIFFSAPSRAPFQPPPRHPGPVERPHFHGRDSPYETVVLPDRRSEWLRRWNPATAGSWSAIRSKWKPGCLWNSQFFRDPYVMFFIIIPHQVV